MYVKIGANLRFRPEDLRSYVNELADASMQKRQQEERLRRLENERRI